MPVSLGETEIAKATGIAHGTVSTLLTKLAKTASSPKPNAATGSRNSATPTRTTQAGLTAAAAGRSDRTSLERELERRDDTLALPNEQQRDPGQCLARAS
jgi:hypothetical protein